MSGKQTFRLVSGTARQMAMRALECAPEGFMVEIKPATRTLEQNARLHAMFADLQCQATLHGRKLLAQQWKVVMMSAHAVATGEGADVLPGLEGEFVNLRASSAALGVRRMASLIDYIEAWGNQHGVRWSAPAPKGWEGWS